MQSKAYIGMYLNTADGVSKIMRQEGLMAFTRGFEPSLWRQGVWNGMSAFAANVLSAANLSDFFAATSARRRFSLLWFNPPASAKTAPSH
jgi:hypothetical protein